MPIIEKYKIIFVHIPKCGGTSINSLFDIKNDAIRKYSITPSLDVMYGNKVLNYNNKDENIEMAHATAKMIRYFHPQKFIEYFKFAIVRNPYDRIVSEYAYKNTRIIKNADKISFREFVSEVKKLLDNRDKIEHINIDHYLPQYEYVYDGDKLIVDRIINFEAYNTSISTLLTKLKITKPIPHENKSNRKHWSKYLTPETEEIIYQMYKKDFELFNYQRFIINPN